jgi:hypothetical protein
MVKEKRKGFPAVLQALDVGNEPAPFNGKDEFLGCSFIPAIKNFFFRETIKGDVQLHRIKIFGVVFEPLFLGKVRGIKSPVPPMGIVIAACPDEDHH